MPRVDIRTVHPHPLSRWRCPCGFEGTWDDYRGHRHGYKKRPECHGNGVKVWEPDLTSKTAIGTPIEEQPNRPIEQVETPKSPSPQTPLEQSSSVPVYEYLGTENEPRVPAPDDDPEAVARRLAAQLNLSTPEDIGGDGHRELIQGDFAEQPAVTPPSLSPVKQTIEVPPVVLVWYNWARDQGWFQGDGTISAFVTDCLLDHFRHCWGYRIVVVSEEEVSIIEQTRS